MMERLFTATAARGYARFKKLDPGSDEALARIILQLPITDEGTIEQLIFTSELPAAKSANFADQLGQAADLDEDSFLIESNEKEVIIYALSQRGRIYALYSLLQQTHAHSGQIGTGLFYARPNCPFRGLKVYLPAPDDLQSFYDTIDFLCYYRYNTIIIEVGGAMEYKKHPEINQAWLEYCQEMARYPERAYEIQHELVDWDKNSIHFENGGGKVLSQTTVADLVAYCRDRGLDVIPEVPSLSHCDYMVIPHPDLAERPDDPYPDTYCPSNPASYELLFDILTEVIDVFQPQVLHIGHDEYYSIGICPLCRERDAAEIFASDIKKIHAFLKERGIRTMFWAEKVLNAISREGQNYGGSEDRYRHPDGTIEIRRPATYTAMQLIPQDVLAHHWYWAIREGFDDDFHKQGIEMVYGNLSGYALLDWNRRLHAGAQGGAPSHWSSLEYPTLQRNCVYMSLVYSCWLFWGKTYTEDMYTELLELCFAELFWYNYRQTVKKPYYEFVHTTTIERPYQFISSSPMQTEKDTIGYYEISYTDGSSWQLPIIHGLNIAGWQRDWQRYLGTYEGTVTQAGDVYICDDILLSLAYSTLPEKDGPHTYYKLLVANPYPEKTLARVQLKQSAPASEGTILLKSFSKDLPPK